MNILRDVSIKRKLIAIAMLTSSVSLLLACAMFVTYDVLSIRRGMIGELSGYASVVGANSTAALSFNDEAAAKEVLSSLRTEAGVVGACLFNADGKMFSAYVRDAGDPQHVMRVTSAAEGHRFTNASLDLFQHIKLNGQVVGTVFIRLDLGELRTRVRNSALIFILVMALALLTAFAVVSRLQRLISQPVSHLAETARSVSTGKDYGLRASKFGNDELGELIDGFNHMLGQIQQRDRELETHRNQLEDQVAQRTRQLTEMNSELAAAVTRAEAGSRAKSNFLANMSHEIRTPMTAILGYADVLLEPQRTPSERHDSLQIIRRNARHLMDLINDILDVSKIEAERMTVEKIEFDLPQLIVDVVSMIRPRAIDKGLGFQLNFTGLIPRRFQGDPLRLKQVLLNILGNALKFTERGAISLSVGCELLPGASRLRFHITDTGVGLAADQVQRLFKPFTQADESTTRKYGGTGLGLVISKKLVELMGGDVSVVSQPGRGSTFTIHVTDGPLDGVEMLSDLSESLLSTGETVQELPTRALKGRILLAEDGPDNQCLISMLLREAGAEVVIAENGRIAVELARAQHFDLIFMDMQMPELDGYGATSKLREMGATLPIVALTAHALAEDRAKCLAAGCTDYCTKPVEKERLIRIACRYLPGALAEAAVERRAPATATTSAGGTRTATLGLSQQQAPGPVRSDLTGDPSMVQAVAEFVGRLPTRVETLRTQLSSHALGELRRTLHQLKGAGTGYGFPAISELAGRAEHSMKSGDPLDCIAAEVKQLIELITRVEGYQSQPPAGRDGEETSCATAS